MPQHVQGLPDPLGLLSRQSGLPDPLGLLDRQSGIPDPLGLLSSRPANAPAGVDEGVTSLAEANAIEDQARGMRIEFLKKLLERSDISPEQRTRVEAMIKRMGTVSVAGLELTNPITEDRFFGSNFLRGVGKIITELPITVADIGAGVAELSTKPLAIFGKDVPDSVARFFKIPEFRARLHDSQAWIKGLFDPQGLGGLSGQAAGIFVGPVAEGAIAARLAKLGFVGATAKTLLNPFGVLNSAGMRALTKVPGVGPRAAAVVARGTKEGATYLERLSAQLIGAGAVDVAVAADLLTTPGMTDEQRAASLFAIALMSGGAAVAGAAFRVKPTIEEIRAKRPVLEPPVGEGEVKVSRGSEARGMTETARINAERKALSTRISKAAKADWEARNPGKSFKKDLDKEQRAGIVRVYRQKVAPVADTNLDKGVSEQLELTLKELGEARTQRDEALRLADTDQLTGYANKSAFERARPAVDADPTKEIVYFDVKNFKAYNDSFGNVEADALLKDYSRMIETATRATNNHARIFRQGDEFFVIVEKGTGQTVSDLVNGLVPEQLVGEFQVGFRSAIGDTFEEASLNLVKVKTGEVGPKARPGTVVVEDGKVAPKETIKRTPEELRAADQGGKVAGRIVSDKQEIREFRELVRKEISKLTDEELVSHRNVISELSPDFDTRLAQLNEELARRARPGGFTVNTPPEVVGAVAGFAAGMIAPIPEGTDESRFALAVYLAAAGALGGRGIRMLNKAKRDAVPSYQAKLREQVKSVEDAPLQKRVGIFTHMMRAYQGIARRDIPITNVGKVTGSASLPAGKSAGKKAELFGLWRGMTDRWLFGDRGPGIFNNEGEWVQFDALTLQQIANMVGGDLRTVGDLAAAARELELRAQTKPRTTGLDIETARIMYTKTPEKYHQARVELTKAFRAMADLQVFSGILSKETRAKFNEQTWYVAIRRLFDGEVGEASQSISAKGGARQAISVANLNKFLKGGKRPFQNPTEAYIDLLPRIHRQAEMNRLMTTFFDDLLLLDPADRAGIATLLTKAKVPKVKDLDIRTAVLRKELKDAGTEITGKEAEAIVTSLSDESLNVTSDVVRFFRNGEMETWRVSDPVAKAFRSMYPHELNMVMASLGILTKPTNFARVGITANPVFVGWQAWRDIWQFHQNGTYGLAPNSPLALKIAQAPLSLLQSGAGSLKGWLSIMFRTGEYRNFLDVGTGGESIASQGLRIVRGDIKKGTGLLTKIKETPSKNQFDQIVKEIKQGSLREVYASLLQPVADAARVGAFLKERGRGADVIEAVYRAKKAGANWANRGSAVSIQALNRMTLFLNPSIQGLDASRFAFQKDPTGYIIRGIAGITIPSMLLWAAYNDDEEIVQLRGTPQGKRFWWLRVAGQIVKLPRPIFDGQVFGALAESWLDQRKKDDPEAINNWVEAMWNDAAVNLLPFIGVVPISMATGKIVGLGSDVVPQSTQRLDVTLRSRPESSTLARIVSNVVAPIQRNAPRPAEEILGNALSPAGLDFMMRQFLGTGRFELARGLSIAIDVSQGHDIPPKEELPFIRSAFGKFPSLNVAAIREFYAQAGDTEEVVNTVNYLAAHRPEELAKYLESRLTELAIAKIHSETRKQLSDLRKAIEDIREAPADVISDKDRRFITQTFMESMILLAKNANLAARSITKSMKSAAEK